MAEAGGSRISGRCLCGAVTFSAEVARREAGVCHCRMCQSWTGGPFVAVECVEGSLAVGGAEHLGVYPSSAWATRQFCKTCGSTLFWRSNDGKFNAVSAGALDDKSDFTLVSEIFIDEKPAYYDFANKTKRMTGAEFTASLPVPPASD